MLPIYTLPQLCRAVASFGCTMEKQAHGVLVRAPAGKKFKCHQGGTELHILFRYWPKMREERRVRAESLFRVLEQGFLECRCLLCLRKLLNLEFGTPFQVVYDMAKEKGLLEM